ncbi:MAG: PEP-CTERM sorting domain-containing protein [Gammaproteobacteria bacterium]|nr:PEP-CTERM sorting domain-containing protein [Gammaproteobacteria bacterium]MDH3767271.1 PEP-CTERM sorting domain-containing protein [Gammaproteobacteria bacterium]
MTTIRSITINCLLATGLLLPLAANAAPIQGSIAIGGSLIPICAQPLNCTMDIATGIDFLNDDRGLVNGASGDFALFGVSFGDIVAMNDFQFSPIEFNNPLWSVGGFSFAMETLNIHEQTATVLELRGRGLISFDGDSLDPTIGRWSFSTDAANTDINFSWSSTAAAPEPGILILMGMGLIGGIGARRLARA